MGDVTETVGMLALLLCAPISTSQALYLWRRRHRIPRGASVGTPTIVTATSLVWGGYGLSIGDVAVTAMALIDLMAALVCLALLLPASWFISVLLALPVVVTAVWSIPSVYLGSVGAVTSAVMFLPQAARSLHEWGTPAARGVSPVYAALIVVGNTLWVFYGLALSNLLLWGPSTLHVVGGVLIALGRSRVPRPRWLTPSSATGSRSRATLMGQHSPPTRRNAR